MITKERNINIDLVKAVAVFLVISVHFFKNNGFYDNLIIGSNMYILTIFRTLCMMCVPLFIVTTGYLMKNKTINRKYYFGLSRVLITYVLITSLILIYNKYYLKDNVTIMYSIKKILEFDIGYSWYIEMYIGLFLLIPFINLIYNNLKNNSQKRLLILTLLFLTSFQGILNIKYTIIPDWWINIYPLTYYFIGCYLKENKIKVNKYLNILVFIMALLISSFVNIYISKGNLFVRGVQNDWGSIFNVITIVLVFNYIINLNLNNINVKIKRIIVKISELSLGIYLSSAMIDDFLYFNFYKNVNFLNLEGYVKIVPLVFVLSIAISMIINWIYKLIDKYIIKKVTMKL